jgi:hypothetical protein
LGPEDRRFEPGHPDWPGRPLRRATQKLILGAFKYEFDTASAEDAGFTQTGR